MSDITALNEVAPALRGALVVFCAMAAVAWGIGSGMAVDRGSRGECRSAFLMACIWAVAAGLFSVVP